MSVRAFGFLAASALLLTGCAPEPDAAPSTPTPAAVSASPTPTPADPCADAPQPSVVTGDVVERLGNYSLVMLVDTGARDGANGTTTVNDAGEPTTYVVASDDRIGAIAERLCSTENWLQMLNSVRRDSSYSDTEFVLYAGDALNLDPHTIRSVGDQNSAVRSYEPLIHIPAQQ